MQQSSPEPTLRERFNISRLAIKYSRLTIAFWLVVMVAGLFAFSSLKYALFPDITFPVVVVNAQATFKTAIETEAKLTQPIEQSLASLKKLDQIYSSSYPGQTIVKALFIAGTNLESATESVKTALEQLSLPQQATFEVIPINLNESTAITYAITSQSKSLEELVEIAQEKIIPDISKLPGVLKVNLLGDAKGNPQQEKEKSLIANFPTLVRFNGENGLAFQVIKRGDGNTLDVVNQVQKAVQKLQVDLPEVRLVLAENQAGYINEATHATIDALLGAIILAVLVIFPFLRSFQATLITAIAIPISLLGTCIVMAISDFNLETITLLALALVIGIVVDDAIVDVENISRYIDQGETPRQAAIRGTDEIGLAVSASTLTIVAVFLPVAFMGGAVGQFFKPFGLTVSAAVIFSLLVSRTLSPVLAVYWLKPKKRQGGSRRAGECEEMGSVGSRGKESGVRIENSDGYSNLLKWSLNHRKIVIGIAILSFIAGIVLIPLIPKGFIPKLDRGEFNIVYTTPLPKLLSRLQDNSQLESKSNQEEQNKNTEGAFDWLSDLAKSPGRILLRRPLKVAEQLEKVVLASPEVQSVFTVVGIRGEPNKGMLYVKLKPNNNRQLSTSQVQEKIRRNLPKLPDIIISVEDIPFIQTEAEKNLQIAILGKNLNLLRKNAQEIKNRVKKLPGFVDVVISGKEDLEIERLNGQRVIYLSANLKQNQALENAALQIEQIAKAILPKEITLDRWGSSAHSSDVLESFAQTLGLSLICMLVLLFLLFGRLLEPIVIVLSLPLSIVGAMLGLLITQSDFGVISLIGLIFLLGLLNKNAILLMDYTNQLRKLGKTREEAILETGKVRLRPILMTTASTILGMLPIALGLGAGAELRQPMAVTIIGGLITSSLLSLIVVPVLYTLLEDLWDKKFRNSQL